MNEYLTTVSVPTLPINATKIATNVHAWGSQLFRPSLCELPLATWAPPKTAHDIKTLSRQVSQVNPLLLTFATTDHVFQPRAVNYGQQVGGRVVGGLFQRHHVRVQLRLAILSDVCEGKFKLAVSRAETERERGFCFQSLCTDGVC